MTREIIRKGGNKEETGRGRGNYSGNKRRFAEGPIGDPTPPPRVPPTLTGAEKAERQLLRALFSPEWRAFILGRLRSDLLITPQGHQLLARIARTPATPEGGIDPLSLLRQVESEEEQAETEAVKLSVFIRELLEESPFLVSNELLNEAAVSDCIHRLAKHRQDQEQRELAEMLQRIEMLPPEERRAYIEHYHQKVRERRGSAPAADGG
jgi:uncharacterized protein YnzC (UPF0291/DUF896 family)